MARKPESQGSRERNVILPHTPSPNFIAVTADGATLGMRGDDIGAVLQLNFTRVEGMPIAEKFRALQDGNSIQQIGPPEFEVPKRKVIECSVILRPDHALQVAMAILQNVSNMSPHLKQI